MGEPTSAITTPPPAPPHVDPPVWDTIPARLAQAQQWVLWKFEWDAKRSAWLKVPYYVQGGRRTGGQGDDRDRQRLATLPVVRRAFERAAGTDKPWTGVGFGFLPGDGLIGIDLDKCIDDTGKLGERAAKIVQAFHSFTEFSPSGKGLHIYVEGHTTTAKSNDIGVEMFCEKQYFTVTGRHMEGTPLEVAVAEEGAIKRMHATIAEAKEKYQGAAPAKAAPRSAHVPGQREGRDDFAYVNGEAMKALHAWVPALFAGRESTAGQGYRVTSKALGRDLQEDLSIKPEGIVDFGVADMGDPRQGKRTPIDLVMEWGPGTVKPAEALKWLAQVMGIQLSPPPAPRAKNSAPAGGREGAQGGQTPPPVPPGGGGGCDGDADADDLGALYAALHLKGEARTPIDCRENVLYALRHDPRLQGLVRLNQFTELHERSRETPWGRAPGEWDDEDDLMLGEYLGRRIGLLSKSPANLRAGVVMAAREHKYNPVLDLVRSVPWDGIRRLPFWLADCIGVVQSEYTALIGECFIKGMVNRALRPGCKFDYMLILKGAQGAKKSTIFRTLADPWFTDNAIRMGDKDSLMALQVIWIAESSELESMNKSETKAIKQFLSASEDMFRPPYGARMLKRPRHAVFGGTTNEDTFLRDATGDRRFWPIEVEEISVETLAAMRLQLFAEALVMLESDDPEQRRTYPTPAQEKALIFPAQERFKMTDVWEDVLYDYVNAKAAHKTDDPLWPVPAKRLFFSTRELFEHAIRVPTDRIDGNKQMETRISNAMRSIGFHKVRESGGERRRGYERPAPQTPPAATPPPAGPASHADDGNSYGTRDDLPF